MSAFYYFVCTLPMPLFGAEPPIPSVKFIEACSDWVSSKQLKEISSLNLVPQFERDFNSWAVKTWYDWELCLRNRIVEFRSSRLQSDPSEYVREYPDYFSEIETAIQDISSMNDPLAIEKRLDLLRWQKLDSMESGHQFDFDILCIYKLKLMILEKWKERTETEGFENLTNIIENIYTNNKEN